MLCGFRVRTYSTKIKKLILNIPFNVEFQITQWKVKKKEKNEG